MCLISIAVANPFRNFSALPVYLQLLTNIFALFTDRNYRAHFWGLSSSNCDPKIIVEHYFTAFGGVSRVQQLSVVLVLNVLVLFLVFCRIFSSVFLVFLEVNMTVFSSYF